MNERPLTSPRSIGRLEPRRAAIVLSALCAAASALTLVVRDTPSGDQMVVATLAMRDVHPERFAADPFLSSPASRAYLPWLRGWIAIFVRIGWRASTGFGLIALVTVPVYVAGMCVLLRHLGRAPPLVAAIVSLASAVAHPALGGTWYGVWPATTAGARSAWLAVMPWLAVALWTRPTRRAPWLAAGLAANLHPLSGIAFLVIWTAACLLTPGHPNRPRAGQLAAALLGLAPVLAGVLFLADIPAAPVEVYREAMRMRLGYLRFPYPWFSVALMLAGLVPWIAMAASSRGARQENDARKFFVRLAVAALVVPVAASILSQHASAVLGGRNLLHDAVRATRLAYLPLAVLAAWGWTSSAGWRRAAWSIAAAIAFLPTERLALLARTGSEPSTEANDPEFRALCDWASNTTPAGTLFAMPSNAFRYYAGRPITGCTEDGGTLILAGAIELVPWLDDEKRRETLLDNRDTTAWIATAREHDAAYAVVPATWPEAIAPPAFTNSRYRAHRLTD